MAKKGGKSRTNRVDDGVNIGVNVDRDGMAKGKQKVSEGVQSEKKDSDDDVKSDYYNSDEFGELVSDVEELVDDATRKKNQFHVYDPTTQSPYIELGMFFENSTQFKHVALLSIKTNMEKNAYVASQCEVVFNGAHGFKVDLGERRYIINLGDGTCTCRRYQLSGIPCAHAICVIRDQAGNVEDYVSNWFHKEVYTLVYGNVLNSMPKRKDWPKVQKTEEKVLPPKIRKMPRRPKTARRKDPDEPQKVPKQNVQLSRKGMMQTCSFCHKDGHKKKDIILEVKR
ncbi:hypothetical protein REPUB_Repub18cG0015600 [Reevesia pubescens]